MAKITFISLVYSAALTRTWQNHGSIWEIVYCTEGSGTLLGEDWEIHFRAGEFITQPPYQSHRFAPESVFQAIYLMIDEDYPFSGRLKIQDSIDSDVENMLMVLYRLNVRNLPGRATVVTPLVAALIAYINLLNGLSCKRREVALMEQILEDNISNAGFSLQDMYRHLYLTESYARALFKREMGARPNEYLRRLRIHRACQLLPRARDDLSIAEIAKQVGIHDPQYFARLFKQETGLSSTRWLAANQPADTEL